MGNQTRTQSLALAESAAFQTTDRQRIDLRLWKAVERNDDVEAAYYVNSSSSEVIASTGSSKILTAESVLASSGQRNVTRVTTDSRTRVSVSRPFRPYAGSVPVLLVTAPVPNRPDRAVITAVNLEDMSDSRSHRTSQAQFVVVDGEGRVIMSENRSRILAPSTIGTRRLPDRSGFVTVTSDDGVETAVGYARTSSRDWTVTAQLPTAEAYALQTTVGRQFVLMLGLVLCGVSLIGVGIGGTTLFSVRALSAHARALQSGDLDRSVSSTRIDEFGDLFESFEAMRMSLKDQIREAEEARRESERLSNHLERKSREYGEVMRQCADGDLARRVDPTSRHDSMRQIGTSFNRMMNDVEQQNEQLEGYTKVLSHDLRNPLSVAKGRARLIEKEVDLPHTEPLTRSLDRMESIIEDALTLVSQRSVSGTVRLDLATAATDAWSHVETADAALALGEPTQIEADPNLFAHVLENLFRNAIEHGGDDVRVEVGATPEGFYVEDDGPGVPPDRRESVFEQGFTTNRADGGTGFGLAIVRQIVLAHDWQVALADGMGGGARFEIETTRPGRDGRDFESVAAADCGGGADGGRSDHE